MEAEKKLNEEKDKNEACTWQSYGNKTVVCSFQKQSRLCETESQSRVPERVHQSRFLIFDS